MKKIVYFMSAFLLALFTSQNVGASPATTGEMEKSCIYEEDFWSDYTYAGYTVEGEVGDNGNIWYNDDLYLHAFAEGKIPTKTNVVSYLVSPEIQLFTENTAEFAHKGKYFGGMMSECVSLCIREVGGEWVTLEGMKYGAEDEMVSTGEMKIPVQFDKKKVQFGFRYFAAGNNDCGDWQIGDFKVRAMAPAKKDPELSYDVDEVTCDINDAAEFVSPVLNNPNNMFITYYSDNWSVARINDDGTLTIKGAGKALIEARSNETPEYKPGYASYVINVVDPEIVFSAAFDKDNCGFHQEGLPENASDDVWKYYYDCIRADGYYKVNQKVDIYYVSPAMTLDENGNVLSYEQQIGHPGNVEEENQLVIREVGGEWEVIDGIHYGTSEWSYESTGDIELPTKYNGKNVEIGFKYVTDGYSLTSTWQVRNLMIKRVSKVRKDAEISYDVEQVDYALGSGPFVEPVLNNPNNLEISYTSDNYNVAQVDDKTGKVTIKSEGVALITAVSGETEDFKPGKAFYVIKVSDPNIALKADFKSDECGFKEEVVEGRKTVWTHTWDGYMKADGFNKVDKESSFYLISPEFKLGAEGNTVSYEQTTKYFEDRLSEEAQFVIREVGGEWQVIDMNLPADDLKSPTKTDDIQIPAEFNGKKVQVAFKYTACGNADSGVWKVAKLMIRKQVSASEKVEAGIAYDVNEVSYTMGDEFVAPVLSNPNNVEVVYSSSDENVATVSAEGEVTVLGEGVTTIKAVSAETDKYLAGEASYVLTVSKAQGTEAEVLFEESFASNLGEFTEENADGSSSFWQWFFITQSAYATGAKDSRLVSPEIQLGTSNTVSFDYRAMDFTDLATQVYLSVREVNGEWTDIALPVIDNDANWTTAEFMLPAEFDNKNVQVAVRYNASNDATLCVKNLVVKGVKGDDVPTGINGITAEDLNSGKIYDIQGRKLNKLQKGLNIVNGKKIFVK